MLKSVKPPISSEIVVPSTHLSEIDANALHVVSQMAGRVFANWWSKVGPYYTKTYQEMWVGIGLIGFCYYKLSYGSKY